MAKAAAHRPTPPPRPTPMKHRRYHRIAEEASDRLCLEALATEIQKSLTNKGAGGSRSQGC